MSQHGEPAPGCFLCGTGARGAATDYLVIRTPAVPRQDTPICQTCARTLAELIKMAGSDLTVHLEDAQQRAGERDCSPSASPYTSATRHSA